LIEMALRVGAAAYVRQNNAMIARSDLRPVLPTIQVPTAVMVGEHDRMTPPPCSREITGAIKGASLHLIPECGHLPPIEKPRIIAERLRELIRAD
jgi:pimeloyl-ACP methyl ester carboxylesterase